MTAKSGPRFVLLGTLLLAASLAGWWLDRTAFLAAWLAAWFYGLGIVMGGLASVWIHTLTAGAWGEAIRGPVLRVARLLPGLSLLFLPILVGLDALYPWSAPAGQWANELTTPAFKLAWLQPGFFIARAIAFLAVLNLLAWGSRLPALARSRGFAAAALLVYGFTIGMAAVDWIMSLMPLWYSSSFGLVAAMGQVLSGMALAAAIVCRQADACPAGTRRDIGNFLLAYVLTWAYLAFTQFLIIWAENLPHEIAWYVPRRNGVWLLLGIAVALFNFAVPLLLLLFRSVKDSARRLGRVAGGLLVAQVLDVWWLILPSVADRIDARQLLWLLPLTAGGFAALGRGLLPNADRVESKEMHHV